MQKFHDQLLGNSISRIVKNVKGDTIFKPLSYNFRHKNNIFISEQPLKDIEFDL